MFSAVFFVMYDVVRALCERSRRRAKRKMKEKEQDKEKEKGGKGNIREILQ